MRIESNSFQAQAGYLSFQPNYTIRRVKGSGVKPFRPIFAGFAPFPSLFRHAAQFPQTRHRFRNVLNRPVDFVLGIKPPQTESQAAAG
jgi:hypothetical protein